MLLSHRCTYGLRLALFLAERGAGTHVAIHEVAEALGMPSAFLSKTAQSLVQAGLLVSRRGPGGGVALARKPEAILLSEIVLAIDGPGAFTECVLGLPGCGHLAPCPLHGEWASTRERIRRVFEETTLDAFPGDGRFRLAAPTDATTAQE